MIVDCVAERDGWVLHFKYHPTIVDAIKTVPGTYRHWRQATRTWWVADYKLDDLRAELARHGHGLRFRPEA